MYTKIQVAYQKSAKKIERKAMRKLRALAEKTQPAPAYLSSMQPVAPIGESTFPAELISQSPLGPAPIFTVTPPQANSSTSTNASTEYVFGHRGFTELDKSGGIQRNPHLVAARTVPYKEPTKQVGNKRSQSTDNKPDLKKRRIHAISAIETITK